MLGLGETRDELRRTMADLRANGVDVVTFGQYLRPTEKHLSVVEYVHPDVFEELREEPCRIRFRVLRVGADGAVLLQGGRVPTSRTCWRNEGRWTWSSV